MSSNPLDLGSSRIRFFTTQALHSSSLSRALLKPSQLSLHFSFESFDSAENRHIHVPELRPSIAHCTDGWQSQDLVHNSKLKFPQTAPVFETIELAKFLAKLETSSLEPGREGNLRSHSDA
ncbi:hypothetical protein PIB30_035870 [Stylosanthes scabra]|uniref:Uncharacterized protein n=1 Tax=Stylosanthes scabra TaxID=79078 RepID=A0ABU6SDN7_9FABA|nr:hypothetical protein [Stylosanthes scabra]